MGEIKKMDFKNKVIELIEVLIKLEDILTDKDFSQKLNGDMTINEQLLLISNCYTSNLRDKLWEVLKFYNRVEKITATVANATMSEFDTPQDLQDIDTPLGLDFPEK